MSRPKHRNARATDLLEGADARTEHLRLAVNPARVILWVATFWLAVEILLVVLDVLLIQKNLTTLVPLQVLFNLEREDSLGNWLASLQTFLVGLTLWVIYWRVRQQPRSRGQRTGWAVLAGFFTYLAIDDGAEMHERIGSAVVDMLNRATAPPPAWLRWVLDQFPTYMWHLVFGPLFAVIGVFMLVFLLRELTHSRVLVLLGIWCLVLAIGLDVLDGYDGLENILHVGRVAEEFIEMLGFTILWVAFLKHLFQITGTVTITLAPRPGSASG